MTTGYKAIAGIWHAVAFDSEFGSPPTNYDAAAATTGYVVEDNFEATAVAIPEFPTVMAAIAVAGLCFGSYYWKVGAVSANSYSTWSAVGAFTTESAPSPPPQPLSPPPPPAQSPTQSTFPDRVIYLIGALQLTIVILLITLLVLVAGTRRS